MADLSFEDIHKQVKLLDEECSSFTVAVLKAKLRKRNLKTSGIKVALVKRLIEARTVELFKSKTNKYLRIELRRRKLPVSGPKKKKIERLLLSMDQEEALGPDYSSMTVNELKVELKKKGLPVSGIKSKLIERLKSCESLFVYSIEDSKYWSFTIKILKEKLKERGLRITGNKKSLIKRLDASDGNLDYSIMNVNELRFELKKRGLRSTGNKMALIERLKNSPIPSYEDMKVKELRQLCFSLGLPQKGTKAILINRLKSADSEQIHKPYFSTNYAHSNTDIPSASDWVLTAIVFLIPAVLIMGCIGALEGDDYEEDSSYSSSSSSPSSSSSQSGDYCANGGADDRWCYSHSLNLCVYYSTSSQTLYYKEAAWYGC